MSPTRATLCLVTPHHLANNPRVVKEACALQEAGYPVTVVAGRHDPRLDPVDLELASRHRWTLVRVDHTRRGATLAPELMHRSARFLIRIRPGLATAPGLAALAHHRASRALAATAHRCAADLYIGHTAAGLAAAGVAALRRAARLGFDAEDFHPEETREAIEDPVLRATLATIERRWLPRCAHLTAASPLIARAYVDAYGIDLPTTVLNVFPRRESPAAPRARPPGYVGRRLYWYSQTIGPGRGLEPLLSLLGQGGYIGTVALRGRPVEGYLDHLRAHARAAGFTGEIEALPLAAPHQLVTLALDHSVGLALEERTPRNRDLCLTNKLFTYLLAGLPVVLSRTRAQEAIAAECGDAAHLLDATPGPESAARLVAWLLDPAGQVRARARAWELGQQRFCWEVEQHALLAAVQAALRRPGTEMKQP